jgi:multiple sugar transport system permease protein
MCAPYYLIFFTFTILPVILSLFFSFTIFNMIEAPQFIFLDNYMRLFLDDDIFIEAVANTLIFAVMTGPVSYILSLFTAWFINELPPKVRAVVTLIFYAPSLSTGMTFIWKVFFDGDSYGYANSILMRLDIIQEPIQFFKNEAYVMPLCIVVALWSSLGVSFLSFIGGLQTVPKDQFEAAAVDGIKNRWQEVWYITLPNMKSMLMFGAVMAITGAFGFGAIVTQLCGTPSVNYCAWTLAHHMGEYMTTRFEFGYASALALVQFILVFGANKMINKMLAKVGQ